MRIATWLLVEKHSIEPPQKSRRQASERGAHASHARDPATP
ncbi:hypothetical protein [Burkholderia plantarii]|nr:hypothetical protein [Burkholderia plantarii]